ncbi:hypothetical protein [Pararobbsia alpina]|nr:hypothetical protein [Pararobbsia alpina]
MTTGRAEAERYVSRCHPGSVIVEVFVDGHAVKPGAPDPTPADWKADAVRKQNATVAARKRKPKLLPVASDREAFSEVDDYGNLRNAAKVEPVEFALDAESIATYWDLTADGLPDFIEWLCEGWTEPVAPFAPVEYLSEVTGNPWTGFAVTKRPIGDPSEASAAVADAIALPEVSEAVLSESEQPENESEWAGCYIVRDGVTTYVCDYAKERGISDEEAAIVLGMLDTDYSDEPEPAAAPESEPAPEPVKAAPAPTPKKLTGKQLRKLEKAQRRVERQQGDPQPAPNRMPAKQTAIAARAYALLQAGK